MIGFAIESIFNALDRVVGEGFFEFKDLNPLKTEFYSEMFTKLTILYAKTIEIILQYKPDMKEIGGSTEWKVMLTKPTMVWASFTGVFQNFIGNNHIYFLEYLKNIPRTSTSLRTELTQLKLEKSELEAKVEELSGLNTTLQTKNEELLEEQFEWELERSQLMQQAKEAKTPKGDDKKTWGFRRRKKRVNGGSQV